MNLLIVADKSEIKSYQAVIKNIPNLSVLGTVTRINTDFVEELQSKPVIRDWNRFLFAFARLVACLSAQINVAYRELTGVDVIVKAA